MSILQIRNLSFSYPAALTPVFEGVDLDLDTSWRLGLIGRNGRGKTTFLNLLRGTLKGEGSIHSPEAFEYFPYVVEEGHTALEAARRAIAPFTAWEAEMARLAANPTPENMEAYGDVQQAFAAADGYAIDELIAAETGKLGIAAAVLRRPYATLSGGERVKLLLAAAFLKKHRFLLIDEPTDHLDTEGRRTVARWLSGKSRFILVSHDRRFLDEAVDHILAINRAGIELQKGNYSSWRHNRTLQDEHEKAENRKLEGSIRRLQAAAERTERWSDKIEKGKIGAAASATKRDSSPVDRGYVGHQAARMMQRGKAIERRRTREVEQKQSLLKNVEEAEPLKFLPLQHGKSRLITAQEIAFGFGEGAPLLHGLSFTVDAGARVAVQGTNGSGKSTLLALITGQLAPTAGHLNRAGGLVVSTLPQDTGFLQGSLQVYTAAHSLDESLFLAILRKLDFEREAFARPMEGYSAGQKKKVCLAASLATPAHLYVWDEPLNYIDVISREQIEAAVLQSAPTMVFVEHDAAFVQNVATRAIQLG